VTGSSYKFRLPDTASDVVGSIITRLDKLGIRTETTSTSTVLGGVRENISLYAPNDTQHTQELATLVSETRPRDSFNAGFSKITLTRRETSNSNFLEQVEAVVSTAAEQFKDNGEVPQRLPRSSSKPPKRTR
jgi:hypothetical protein